MKTLIWTLAFGALVGIAVGSLWVAVLTQNAYNQAEQKLQAAPNLPELELGNVAPGDKVRSVLCPGPNPCEPVLSADGGYWLCWDDSAGGYRCRNAEGAERVTE